MSYPALDSSIAKCKFLIAEKMINSNHLHNALKFISLIPVRVEYNSIQLYVIKFVC